MSNSLQLIERSARTIVAPTLFGELDNDTRQRLLADSVLRSFSSGQMIQQKGDAPTGFWVIESGRVKIGVFGLEGDFRVIALLSSGDSYGELALLSSSNRAVDAVADGPVRAHWVRGQAFEDAIAQNPAAMRKLIGALSSQLQETLGLIAGLGNGSSFTRIAAILTTLSKAASATSTIVLSQQDLGELTGLTRVTVNKCLARLEAMGAIKRAYGKIEILDRALIDAASRA